MYWSGESLIAFIVGPGINFVKMTLYYIHERVWKKTDWDREK
ncbi:MAG: DUF2061 domain-containing protein [Candidatus Aenigmatarchaeota archaeon]